MITASTGKLDIQANAKATAKHVAEWLTELALAAPGRFSVVLSGGSTPKLLYELLAESPFKEKFPWDKTHWFWGDERDVPQTDDLSNYKMVLEAMLSKVPVPKANIHAVKTELATPEETAADYERELKGYYGADTLGERPIFDVNFMGLGEDGHTASLFPGTAVLKEKQKWVAAVIGAKPEARITMTYPILAASKHVAFLVTGEGKKEILKQVLAKNEALPASHVTSVGDLYWFLDEAAAALVK